MLKVLKKALKKATTNAHQQNDHAKLDYNNLPVMTGEALVDFLGQTNRIRSIRRKVLIDSERFEMMYLQPIYRFCEIVQLAPASQAHHHAFAGGLIIHTLSVIEIAINERYKYTLPISSQPHIIEAQKHLWTFNVFVAGLCHDIGKIVTMLAFIDVDSENNEAINILGGTLTARRFKNYKIAFKPTNHYQLHQRIGISFLNQLLNETCLAYLSDDLDIFRETIGYIQNDSYEWGSIGKIVQTADQISTAESLKIATGSRKFPGANLENFGERIMRTLRIIFNNSSIAKNRAGAAIWIGQNHTYCVAKPFAEMIREEMEKQGATDVPTANTRIFDELQHQSFCETNPVDGQAIFKIEITLSGKSFSQTFTCIKILNKHIFAANNLPPPLAGRIVEVTHDVIEPTINNTKASEPTIKYAKTSEPVVSHTKAAEPAIEKSSKDETDDILNDLIQDPEPTLLAKTVSATETAIEISNTIENKMPSDAEIVADFFGWIHDQVQSKEYTINRDSPLFIVEYESKRHLAMMSPIIFAVYAHVKKYVSSIDSRTEIAEAAKLIQKAFQHQKINVGVAGQQVHYYIKANSPSAKSPKLSFYLVPIDKITNNELRGIIEKMEYSASIKRQFSEAKKSK